MPSEGARPDAAQAFAGTAVLVVIALVAGLWTQKGEPLDHQGCPKETGPSREVVVLLILLTRWAQAQGGELRRIVREIGESRRAGVMTRLL